MRKIQVGDLWSNGSGRVWEVVSIDKSITYGVLIVECSPKPPFPPLEPKHREWVDLQGRWTRGWGGQSTSADLDTFLLNLGGTP